MIPIKMIWLSDNQCNIGYDNDLLIKIPADLIRFQKLTKGNGNNAVVMGRITFESLGSRPLTNRLNIVLSKDPYFQFKKSLGESLFDCERATCIREVLEICEGRGIEELWVIGGAEVYKQFEELASHFYHTFVDTNLLPENVDSRKVSAYSPNLSYTNFYECIHFVETINEKNVQIEYNTYVRD